MYECDRCGQTALTPCAINKDGLCECCQVEIMHGGKNPWQDAVDHVAEKLKEKIDEETLKKFRHQEEE